MKIFVGTISIVYVVVVVLLVFMRFFLLLVQLYFCVKPT